jgi:hypothetical protein
VVVGLSDPLPTTNDQRPTTQAKIGSDKGHDHHGNSLGQADGQSAGSGAEGE